MSGQHNKRLLVGVIVVNKCLSNFSFFRIRQHCQPSLRSQSLQLRRHQERHLVWRRNCKVQRSCDFSESYAHQCWVSGSANHCKNMPDKPAEINTYTYVFQLNCFDMFFQNYMKKLLKYSIAYCLVNEKFITKNGFRILRAFNYGKFT